MACIEMSGMSSDGSLTNVERIMAASPSGEAVGLGLNSPGAVEDWMRTVDSIRCRCFMDDSEVWVPKSSVGSN